MENQVKSNQEILVKLGIEQLNPMQLDAIKSINDHANNMLLAPTGSGKTLAFLLSILTLMEFELSEIQTLIVVPTRELALQIEQVLRVMGTGFKVNAIYGGRTGQKDKIELRQPPAILIGTPGRIADRIRRGDVETNFITHLILDEFDKSLAFGFISEMKEIMGALPMLRKKTLTSATQQLEIPEYLRCKEPKILNYLEKSESKLELKAIIAKDKKKLEALQEALGYLGDQPGIVFCNFKDTVGQVSDFLNEHKISHGCFSGNMDQMDRERTLIKFRNGSLRLIIATDLAARGLDIPQIKVIIHFELPYNQDEFTHRNGRTARMNKEGIAYVMQSKDERLPTFIAELPVVNWEEKKSPSTSLWQTLFVSGGRKDKISKGDLVGFFIKKGLLGADQLGVIEIKHDCAFIGIQVSNTEALIQRTTNQYLKKRKVRISLA